MENDSQGQSFAEIADTEESMDGTNLDDAVAMLDDESDADGSLNDETHTGDEPSENSFDEQRDDPDDPLVPLGDGSEIPLSELRDTYSRAKESENLSQHLDHLQDHVAEQKHIVMQEGERVSATLQSLLDFTASLIPPAPSLELAHSNPAEYQYLQALHQNAVQEMENLYAVSNNFDSSQQQFTQEQIDQQCHQSYEVLVRKMPHLLNHDRLDEFNKRNRETALSFGFSDEEINSTIDPRILELVHYAGLGKRAEHNRNNARRRVASPRKNRGHPAKTKFGSAQNTKAMQRLEVSGSISDAALIDFD